MILPPPEVVAPEDLVEELASVFAHRDRLDARLAELLRRTGDTKAFRRDGFSSLTALLKYRMSIHPGEAQRLVARANGLTQAPLVALAFETGASSGAQVDVLLEARSTAPDVFAEAEGHLVTVALDTPLIRDLKKQLDYWLDQVAADDLGAGRNLVRDLRSLTLRREGEMMRINGGVDIEAGERLRADLEPGPPAEGDTRSTPARRADVLLDILTPRIEVAGSRQVGCSKSSAACPDSEARERVAHFLSREGSNGCHRTRATDIRHRVHSGSSRPTAGAPPTLRGGPDESKPARAIP